MGKEWASLLTGLALAGVGLAAFAASGSREAAVPAEQPAPVPAAQGARGEATPATLPPAGDIPAAVAAVLAENGSLETVDPGPFGIPAAVARVLAERGVVLQVPATPPPIPAPGMGR